MKIFTKLRQFLFATVFLLAMMIPYHPLTAKAQTQVALSAGEEARVILDKMTPEERVGQLFLVSFNGASVPQDSQIYDLIVNHHVGGVILSANNNNFVGPDNTVSSAYQLISSLQQVEWEGSQTTMDDPNTGSPFTPQYIPLFIALSQEGDLSPYDQIINGLTPLPDEMAIGATWNREQSQLVGSVLGSELSKIGVNLFLGPSLDVLDISRTEGEDLGTRTFGGDPYWVGELGKSYIEGIHQGSDGRIAVIAKNFPGRGSSDRPPEEEIATVRKSLEQLKQIELAPFFSVTGNAPALDATTDGLLLSHIRYQGFQGNIRATTRPVSFDSAALELLMNLPQFTSWRDNGGIIVSDNLGSTAVRKFFDPLGQSFDARQVARNAFIAGNDLLYLNNFIASGDPDQFTTIHRTLELFAQKYREDTAFAARVDTSVLRLLTLKFKLYPEFTVANVIPNQEGLLTIGNSQQITYDIAQEAAALINPLPADLNISLPNPPGLSDRTVFITDVIGGKQCPTCPDQVTLPIDALQKAVVRLYGPQAGGQITQYRLSSYSFSELTKLLDNIETDTNIAEDIQLADWVVFAMVSVNNNRPDSLALRRFLSEKPELLNDKKIIVFCFNAPYYLDSTDISKITAYYALYSKLPAFVDVAARILFQELVPTGALPVSVPGIEYDLIVATSPDPDQVIPLMIDQNEIQVTPAAPITTETPGTQGPPLSPGFRIGDTIPLITGIILDHNQHPVPDGTVVKFIITNQGETGTTQQIEAETNQGIARTSFQIQEQGSLVVHVTSDPAINSQALTIDVIQIELPLNITVTPTETLTATPLPTATPMPPTPTPIALLQVPSAIRPNGVDWLLSMIIIVSGAVGIFFIGRGKLSLRWGMRWGLLAASGGFLAYIILALIPTNRYNYLMKAGIPGLLIVIVLGIAIGWGSGLSWSTFQERRSKRKS
jgi:beta-N-acetylhexosaminidase